MRNTWRVITLGGLVLGAPALPVPAAAQNPRTATVVDDLGFHLNASRYFVRGGVNVMAFDDFYPDGHQGGITVVQQGVRVAANGDVRLDSTPGQWSPVPRQVSREVDTSAAEVRTRLAYPDPDKNRTGYNPIAYPDLQLNYVVRVRADGDAVRVSVDFDRPVPEEWAKHVGFNLELYPAQLFGRSWALGGASGLFPRQANGPVTREAGGRMEPVPLASGRRLVVAPENPAQRLTIESLTGDLQLYDGRVLYNNGWFVVRSLMKPGATKGAIEWLIRPNSIPGWRYGPVVQVSQVGYHPLQKKVAVLELDARDRGAGLAQVSRVSESGALQPVLSARPTPWGNFLRYRYLQLDFTRVTQPGMYVVEYRGARTSPFRIAADVYQHDVWQPTLDYFLPVQMCHVKVVDQYRVWHGVDHLDDARMAPVAHNHFDGYVQGPATLTRFQPGESVPGLNAGGWHDAGDDDLRIESQADEVWILAAMYEQFHLEYDATSIDEAQRLVRIHRPDGQPDLLQQVEHGLLTVLGSYRALGRFYRGIIVPTMDQYVLTGDVSNSTDNLAYDSTLAGAAATATHSGLADDRWVFTEQNPAHEYKGIAALAIAARVLSPSKPALASEALTAAEDLWRQPRDSTKAFPERVEAATELLLATGKPVYRRFLLDRRERLVAEIGSVGWALGRALPLVGDSSFAGAIRAAVAKEFARVQESQRKDSPYGVPYRPHIWGAGWDIQRFGVEQYFLHRGFPGIVTPEYMLNALNFVLGVHPGSNTASFASGVGARSMTIAYGYNRADWSYIPGGVVSGTALIRPDLPEMKDFPYLWQQAEYVMGGGATHFMFLALAADQLLNQAPGARDALAPSQRH